MALPAYQAPNALNFEPIQQGFNAISQNALARNQQAMEQQRLGMEQATNTSQLKSQALQQQAELIQLHARAAAGIAAADPADQPKLAAAYLKQYPEMSQHITNNGYDINDVPSWTKSIIAEGLGPQNPLDVEQKQLGLKKTRQDIEQEGARPVAMGTDAVTGQPLYGTWNNQTKKYEPVQFQGAGVNSLPATTDAKGQRLGLDDYLKGIPDPGDRGKVGAVLRGDDTLAAIGTRQGQNYGQRIQRYVYNYDDKFDPTQASNRVTIEKDLANPKQGHLGAFSASIGKMGEHLNQLVDNSQNLQTTPILVWNRVNQAFETQKGSPDVPRFRASANIYMHELAKVLKGGSGVPTDKDMEDLATFFSAPLSQDQLRGVLSTWDQAAHAAIDSQDSANERQIGHTFDPAKHSVITPYAQKQFDRLDKHPWLHPQGQAPNGDAGASPAASGLKYLGTTP